MNYSLILAIHNVRSAYNVGAILRTADGFGVDKILMTGYTPHPPYAADSRLPHISNRMGKEIAKTALGAENTVQWEYEKNINIFLKKYRQQGYTLVGLEQTPKSQSLHEYRPDAKLLLVVGNEIGGLEPEVLEKLNLILEIPMTGKKESFNVAAAAAIALYHCQFFNSK